MRPEQIHFAKQTDYIPVQAFSGLRPDLTVNSAGSIGSNMEIGLSADSTAATLEGGSGISAARTMLTNPPVKMSSIGAGTTSGTNKTLDSISTTGFTGLLLGAAGDDVRHAMPFPRHWDRQHDIDVRFWWCSALNGSVTTQTAGWKFLYSGLVANSGVIAAPATALDTVIAADPPIGVAYTLQQSEWGTINARTIGPTVDWFAFIAELDAIGGTFTEAKYLLGVEFQYTLRLGNDPYHLRVPGETWVA